MTLIRDPISESVHASILRIRGNIYKIKTETENIIIKSHIAAFQQVKSGFEEMDYVKRDRNLHLVHNSLP